MQKILNNFLLMLQFLTRIPVNKSLNCELVNFRRGALYLPVVGFIIGSIQWAVYFLLNKVFPPTITAIFVVISGILVTGALHVDGLGDTCDGFFAFKGRERIIEIMKDSRIGTFACIAIIADIALKITATTYLIQDGLSLVIIVSPMVGRFAIVLVSFIGKPAKSSGSGNLFIGNMSIYIVLATAVSAFGLSLVLIGIKAAVIVMAAAFITTFLSNKYSESKIGGLTGDILGANNELVEAAVLLICVAAV